MTIRLESIKAARKRGWSVNKIALAAGVSKQAVAQRLSKGGDIPVPRRKTGQTRTFLRCAECGVGKWMSGTAGAKRRMTQGHYFCSSKCSGLFFRVLSDKEIVQAIELRTSGETWSFIAKGFGVTLQSIQRRIWMRLHEQNILTHALLLEIWRPKQARWRDRQPSWEWLEKSTGITPQKSRTRKERKAPKRFANVMTDDD